MPQLIRVALVDPNDLTRESIKNALLQLNTLSLEAECSRYEFFADVLEKSRPDVGIISLDHDPAQAIQMIETVSQGSPNCGLLVTSESSDGQTILRAIRAGAKEFISLPVHLTDLIAAIDRIGRQISFGTNSSTKRTGSIVAVCGASGGVGATSLAVNLATVLAANTEHSVALLDFDLALGDTDVFLDMIPEHTLIDLLRNSGELDLTIIKKSLSKHASGVHLLPRPVHLEENSALTPNFVTQALGLMKASFTSTILDLSKSYSEVDLEAMRQADVILLVAQLDLPCLRNVVRILNSMRDLKLDSKVKVVLNRVGLDSGQISLKRAKETLGQEIFWQIPNDYGVMVQVRNNGVPLIQQAPKSAITTSFKGLADRVMGRVEAEEDAAGGKKTWLSFLKSRV